jgi:hypothetical protein
MSAVKKKTKARSVRTSRVRTIPTHATSPDGQREMIGSGNQALATRNNPRPNKHVDISERRDTQFTFRFAGYPDISKDQGEFIYQASPNAVAE